MVKINNIEYDYKNADVNYQIGGDMVVNITLDSSYSLKEIANIMKDYSDIDIDFEEDIYNHLNFSSAVKRYGGQESSGGVQVIFTNTFNGAIDERQ